MNLRFKLSVMLSAFLVLIAVLAAGTLLIFDKMNDTMGALLPASERNKLYDELGRNIGDFVETTKNWGLTGDPRFKKLYRKKLSDANKSFGNCRDVVTEKEQLEEIGRALQRVTEYAEHIMEKSRPVGDPEVFQYIQKMETETVDVITKIGHLQQRSVDIVLNVVKEGALLKREMIYYHFSLIICSALIAVFLIVRIRRAITDPFNELLKATERIGKGELSYRINTSRKDEFGTVSKRFDSMVADLESSNRQIGRKLAETELLLDVTRIAGTTPDLRDALALMTETVACKLEYEGCGVYMLRPDENSFCIGAGDKIEGGDAACLPAGEGVAGEIISTLGPVIVNDSAGVRDSDPLFREGYRSGVAVPIIRDHTVSGLLLVRKKSPHVYTDDEISTLKILAHTIGSAIRNAELYLSTKKQLQKLTVLYDLSRGVTSVLDLDDLLKKMAEEISRVLSSKGCIIRLLEDNKLRMKSHFGLPPGVEDEMELSVGEGIAGWVAQEGSPLLVEDMTKMSPGVKVRMPDMKSVICVPLKVGDTVIGTLGLYDKYDSDGRTTPFTVDDMNTAEGFASISAIAIDKSKAYEHEVRREQEAMEAKKRLDVLFDSVQGGIITLDRDYTIISVNKYIEDWVGMPPEMLVGHNSLDIFHEKIGICPHCAAKSTFETGEINTIMQSRGVNYAELTSYPIKDGDGTIIECVVFVQDITERVLYQEETLSLYREVIQTKEYLESIISHSADAIVTTDLEGIITSWNQGAEKTFFFTESEAIGKFMPFVPDFLLDREKENIEKLKKGEVLKDIETLRKKKDGMIIEVSLTLSPIKDAAGEIIGISGISRDISGKKSVEKELIRRNQELSRLFFISSAMRGTLELDKLLRMVLIAVTMSDGMGFNRAILFLVDESKNVLKGAMGVGPGSPEEAWKIWDELSFQKTTLNDIMQEVIAGPLKSDAFFDRLTVGMEIPLDEETVLARAVKEKTPYNVTNVREEALSDTILIQQLGTQAYAVVPLISRDKVIGIIWVDNYFNRKQITDEDMTFLTSFSNHVASAIENARLFEQVTMAEQQLENIFESMSDMVYFNSKDYEIKSVNRAVCNRLGLSPGEIIGKKCYEVFHGMKEPYDKCPHHKTVTAKKAYIEELYDPHMGGTFLTSSSPIFDLTGDFIGSVHVVRDISELKSLREKLVMAEKMAALGEVAAKVAHEIRNPLVSVGGFAKRLEKKLDGNLREYAGIIVKEVERLEEILKEILGFVKEVRLSRETVNVNSLLDDVLKLMESGLEDRGITVTKDFRLQAEVFVDSNRVKEAFVNILSNAVQSISGSGSVSVITYAKGHDAVVEVRDTGKGIRDSERPFIFNPFFTTKAAGTGLGLAITHRIIQEHNGTIEVESEVGKGSVFRVFIPIKEEQR
ncbi:MAG: PAS domain S-box protein [Thermodesulfovibrionales bacterium]